MEFYLGKFDEISKMENYLKKLILEKKVQYSLSINSQLIFSLTIFSILYKEKIYNEYLMDNVYFTENREYYDDMLLDLIVDLECPLRQFDFI